MALEEGSPVLLCWVEGMANPAALETPNVPQLVGRYVLYGAIASGGMATVHFGRLVGPAGFARPVAIKRLHAQFARDPEFVKMFLDEARLAARITHPNVVQTLDLVEGTDEVFLVMDYVRGLTLASLVRTLRRKETWIPPPIVVGITIGVLEGLHAAHEAKDDMGERLDLVHRDVSPQNILVGTDGIARLLDFGVAKASGRSQSTRDGQLKGKVAYMSPEQALGRPLTRRTDIFAASVVLWEMLTARRLFYGESEFDSLRRVVSEEVVRPGAIVELPEALDRVVLKGLERDVAKRYATAHEMALDLAACMVPASAAQIGHWVERTAAEELEERASRIAAIERTAAQSVSRRTGPAGVSESRVSYAPAPVGALLSDVRAYPPPRAIAQPGPDASASAVGAWTPTGRSWSRWLLLSAVGVVLLGTLALMLLIERSARPTTSFLPTTSASPPSETSSPAIVATAPASSTVETAAVAAPSAKPTPTAFRWVGTSAPGGPPRPTRAALSPAQGPGASKPGCDPPYTEDDQGHIHFKPSCM